MRLFLVRHGETPYNSEGRYTGQSDIPLNDLGLRQAEAIGQWMATEPLDAIVSSDLQRTRDTARAIARHHVHSVQEEPDIREVALGDWENCTYAEVAACYPAQVAAHHWDASAAPPGGESFLQVYERASRALARWYARYPEGTMVWVAHGGLIQVVTCRLLDIDLKHRHKFRCANASLAEFAMHGDYASLLRWNDTSHLEQLL